MKKLFAIAAIALALGLAGCDPNDLAPSDLKAVCTALIGPIKYTSENKLSKRYAAALLAMDLKQRNAVGRKLHCPQYN